MNKGLTLRSALIGTLMIPISTYWVMRMEIMSGNVGGGGTSFGGAHYSTCLSIFFNVVFILIILTVINLGLKRVVGKLLLNDAELLTIYVMLSVSTAVAGTDMLQVLIPIIGHPYWFATPENEWESLFFRYLPRWLVVTDRKALRGFYEGGSSLYMTEHLKAWLTPLVMWSLLIIVLTFTMFCMNIMLKKQWIENEKLSYPIVHIPMSIVETGGSKLFPNKLFWLGFSIAGGLDLYNGIAYLHPVMPLLVVKSQIGQFFQTRPWNAIGWTTVAFFPFVVGLGYLIPVELLFSCWIFFIITKVQRIIASALGLYGYQNLPCIREQSFGAYMGICIFALFTGRMHLSYLWHEVKRGNKLYLLSITGFIVGFLFIILFCFASGMSIGATIAFFTLYYLLSLSISRMRAELGAPAHDLHLMDPSVVITTALGTRNLQPADLTMFSLFYSFNRAYRSHPMPHSLEGLKIANQLKMDERSIFISSIMGAVIGTVMAMWILADGFYRLGASARISGYAVTAFGREPFNRLQNWLSYPSAPNLVASGFMIAGFFISIVLLFLRTKFLWWNLHPLGYALSDDYSMQWLWSSLFISWLVKRNIVKFGGARSYRRALPFFIGLVLGEFVVGSLWGITGILLDRPTYSFKYW